MTVLQHTPFYGGHTIDDVCVVVLSEMGRTPYENGGKGKDHWQHICNADGFRDSRWTYVWRIFLVFCYNVDLQSGDVTSTGQDISTRLLGDTLLALGDVETSSSSWRANLGDAS